MTAGTTTEPIDTSDAASADSSAKLLSGRYKAAMVVGPFLVLWLLWRQLGSASVSVTGKYEGEVAGLEWLYRVPRSWTVDWFNFAGREDRKSTRLNSSHALISYAVFCLKKKKKKEDKK